MKNKLLRLLLLLAAILACISACACSTGMDSLDEIIEKNNLTAHITYYSNGGWFNTDTTTISRDIYYAENSKALEITTTSQTKVNHETHVYSGWYTIETMTVDGVACFVCDVSATEAASFQIDGVSVVKYEAGEYVVSIADYQALVSTARVPLLRLDLPFDFSNRTLVKGDRLYLAAKWIPNQHVEYVLLTEGCQSITVLDLDGTMRTVNDGDVVSTKLFDSNGVFTVPTDYNLSPVNSTDATFVDYYVYSDTPDLDNLVRLIDTTKTIDRPLDGNVKVFVKYVAGSYDIVRTPNDVKRIFTSPANKYYVIQDVDCSSLGAFNTAGTFSGTVIGNGYTISGLSLQAKRLSSGSTIALFGAMTSTAVIKDITFEDITLTIETRPGQNSFVNLYLISHDFRDDEPPLIEGVTFDGVTFDVTLEQGVSVTNIRHDGTQYDTTTWFVGGYTNTELLTLYDSLEIINYQLIINDSVIATGIVA